MSNSKIQARDLVRVLLGAVVIAVAAQVSLQIPGLRRDLPLSWQPAAAIVVGFLLRHPAGWLAVLLYLFIGAAGWPIYPFGNGEGIELLKKAEGAYLGGSLLAAAAVGYLAQRGWGQTLSRSFGAMVIGTVIVMFSGWLRVLLGFGLDRAFTWAFFPKIPEAALMALVCAPLVWLLEKRRPKVDEWV